MPSAELKVVGGKQHGSLIPLQTKKFLVGREQDCQLRPSSESVSRHHCVFSVDDFGVRVRDLGSTNGTFVNGQRVQGQVVLQPNDRILIGKLEFEIVIHGAVAARQHERVSAAVSNSDSGFRLSELAELPDSIDAGVTAISSAGTKVIPDADASGTTTTVMHADNTALIAPTAPAPVAPPSTDGIDDIPVVADSVPPMAAVPLVEAVPQVAAALEQSPVPQMMPAGQMAQPQMGMMPPPYGIPQQMPGYPPQPQYLQAPFAPGYPPQYMPSPYGMPSQFMPQPYVDPYQQMAYQQQMAQQQALAQQQAMAQYAMQQPVAEEEPIEESALVNAQIAPAVKLPPPEETGAKAPVAPPPPPAPVEGAAPAAPIVKPNQLAADILKKMKGGGR